MNAFSSPPENYVTTWSIYDGLVLGVRSTGSRAERLTLTNGTQQTMSYGMSASASATGSVYATSRQLPPVSAGCTTSVRIGRKTALAFRLDGGAEAVSPTTVTGETLHSWVGNGADGKYYNLPNTFRVQPNWFSDWSTITILGMFSNWTGSNIRFQWSGSKQYGSRTINPPFSEGEIQYDDFMGNVLAGGAGGAKTFKLELKDLGDGGEDKIDYVVNPHYRFENYVNVTSVRVPLTNRVALGGQYLQSGDPGNIAFGNSRTISKSLESTVESTLKVGKEEVIASELKATVGVTESVSSTWNVTGTHAFTANEGTGYYTLYAWIAGLRQSGTADHYETTGLVAAATPVSFIKPGSMAWFTEVKYEIGQVPS